MRDQIVPFVGLVSCPDCCNVCQKRGREIRKQNTREVNWGERSSAAGEEEQEVLENSLSRRTICSAVDSPFAVILRDTLAPSLSFTATKVTC